MPFRDDQKALALAEAYRTLVRALLSTGALNRPAFTACARAAARRLREAGHEEALAAFEQLMTTRPGAQDLTREGRQPPRP